MNQDTTRSEAQTGDSDNTRRLLNTASTLNSEQKGELQCVSAEELKKVAEERDSLLERLARMQAEFENTRKRMTKERLDSKDVVVGDTVLSLLPAIDSFDLALQTYPRDVEDFRRGLQLIRKQFDEGLFRLGLRPIVTLGEFFDPRIHEAVDAEETTNAQDNQILKELQRGYTLGPRLLRPAKVVVAKPPRASAPEAINRDIAG
jgi:molecular chaperone GrpE